MQHSLNTFVSARKSDSLWNQRLRASQADSVPTTSRVAIWAHVFIDAKKSPGYSEQIRKPPVGESLVMISAYFNFDA